MVPFLLFRFSDWHVVVASSIPLTIYVTLQKYYFNFIGKFAMNENIKLTKYRKLR